MSNKQRKKPLLPQHELRVIKNAQRLEVRKNANGTRSISGYFATFNTLSEDMGFRERIQPGAFLNLKNNPDIVADYNHDSSMILARVSNGSLTVSDDGKGLRFSMTLPLGVSYVNDLIALMESNGLVSSCSFSFSVNDGGDKWAMEGDQLVRTLTSITLYSGSIVGQPAYPKTVADLRSCPVALRSKLKRNADDENPCDPDSSNYDPDDPNCTCDDDDSDEDYRSNACDFRCASHRSANAGWDQTAGYADDDNEVRCAMRCGRCERCRSLHGIQEDDADVRAHAHLLSLRRR
jgi:HK97 family phage prohead protease